MLTISMRLLTKAGLFAGKTGVANFRGGHWKFGVVYDRAAGQIWIVIKDPNGAFTEHEIKCELVQLKFGTRRYFICGRTGRKCLQLYFGADGLACAKYYNIRSDRVPGGRYTRGLPTIHRLEDQLFGRDGYAKPRGARRDRLLAKLQKVAHPVWRSDETDALLDGYEDEQLYRRLAEERKRSRQRRVATQAKDGGASGATARAIAAGTVRFLEQPDLGDALMAGCRARADEPLPRRIGPADPSIDFIDHYAALDMREINRRWGRFYQRTFLVWPQAMMEGLDYVFLMGLLRAASTPLVVVRMAGEDGSERFQTVRLKRSAGKGARWYAVCPITRKTCDVLYLRGGRFASAKAQRLIHRSQRKAKAA